MYLESIKKNRKTTTCDRLDLETLGSRLIMPKNLLEHWNRLRVEDEPVDFEE
jgi:hypothetical protein